MLTFQYMHKKRCKNDKSWPFYLMVQKVRICGSVQRDVYQYCYKAALCASNYCIINLWIYSHCFRHFHILLFPWLNTYTCNSKSNGSMMCATRSLVMEISCGAVIKGIVPTWSSMKVKSDLQTPRFDPVDRRALSCLKSCDLTQNNEEAISNEGWLRRFYSYQFRNFFGSGKRWLSHVNPVHPFFSPA